MPNAIPSTAQKSANGQRPRSAAAGGRRGGRSRPTRASATACAGPGRGTCSTRSRRGRRPRTPGAARARRPPAATITVTGWTLGIGAKRTRPAAARPPSVATSVRSRAVSPPALEPREAAGDEREGGEQRRDAAVGRIERSPAAQRPSAEASEAPIATLDRNGHLRGRVEHEPGGARGGRVVGRDEDAPTAAASSSSRRRGPPCARDRARASARPARAGPARRPRPRRCRAARARHSRDRADGEPPPSRARTRSSAARARRSSPFTASATSSSAVSLRGSGPDPGTGTSPGPTASTAAGRGSSRPAAIRASVVFPDPFAPLERDDLAPPHAQRPRPGPGPSS